MAEKETTDEFDPPPNPARLLARYLREWEVPGNATAQTPRPVNNRGGSADQWRSYVDILDLVRQVHDTVSALEAYGFPAVGWDIALPKWYHAAYMVSTPWASQNAAAREVCDPRDIAALEQLAVVIDMQGPTRAINSTADRETLRVKLQEARALLGKEHALFSDDIRAYLWRLVENAERVIDNVEQVGDEAARSVMYELGGVLAAEATKLHDSGEPAKASWVARVGWGILGGAAGQAGGKAFELGEAGLKFAVESGLG